MFFDTKGNVKNTFTDSIYAITETEEVEYAEKVMKNGDVCGGRRTILTVENTYSAIEEIELSRLFDRFYRADKARTFTGGYGIGLSMAKSITEKQKGEIIAYKRSPAYIGFKIIF